MYNKFINIVEEKNLFSGVDKLLVLFSGGKDCSFLLHVLLRYVKEKQLKIPVECLSVQYPIHVYYDGNMEEKSDFVKIKEYWKARDVSIHYRSAKNSVDFADDDRQGCLTCKRSRKEIIDPFVNAMPARTGLVTGFTMYDSLAYINMLLLNANFDLSAIDKLPIEQAVILKKMYHKIALKELLPNGKYMIRPILPFDGSEVERYLAENHIPFLQTPCKISCFKFKRLYSKALDLYIPLPTDYKGIVKFLKRYGIDLENLSEEYDYMSEDNYFIDC